MLTLTIIRHAKSSWRFADLDDFHRPLNKRGLRDCGKMPRQIGRRVKRPDLLLSSDAVRAVQTAQSLVDGLGLDPARVRVEHRLYLAELDTLLEEVGLVGPEVKHLMLVGHNPGLTDLYNHLLSQPIDNLPTFAVAVLKLDLSAWDQLARGCAELDQMLTPKELLGAD